MSNHNDITLTNGDAQLDLRPAYGGRIGRLAFGDWEVFRPIPEDQNDVWSGFSGGSFTLVPFSNRIKGACFSFDGQNIQIAPHPTEAGNAMHGHGLISEWSVNQQSVSSAELVYLHAGGQLGWPWTYRAVQRFDLNPDECCITLSVTNLSDTSMPLGMGFHPYFPFEEDVDLHFVAEKEWVGSPEEFPTGRGPVVHNFSDPKGAALWRKGKAACYDGYKGEVDIHWKSSGHRLRLASNDLLSHFIIHVPDTADFFCLEPVSHPTDGFNLAAQNIEDVEVLVLQPKTTVSSSISFIRIS